MRIPLRSRNILLLAILVITIGLGLIVLQNIAARPPTCVKEGDQVGGGMACCQGLQAVEYPEAQYTCRKCGDDACSPGETVQNCPGDCKIPCVKAGEQVSGEAVCCRGLQLVEYPVGQFICLECGDDVCSPGETAQNCLKDCKIPCVEEGGQVGGEAVCCRGLQLVEYPAGQFICVECGDDVCSPGENLQNCPKDCRVPCVKAGGVVSGEAKCCRGLRIVTFPDGQSGCLDCGDDVCSPGENLQNCPKDCRVPCVKAGEQVIGEAKCCRGLQSVEYPIGQFTCLKCGDDVCSPGETPEDCPKDCSAAQGT